MLAWRCALLLSLCCGALLAQTFQYSRGWTNGRKRTGPPGPCGRLQPQRLLLLLAGRAAPEMLVACGGWRGVDSDEAASPDYGAVARGRPDSASLHEAPRADIEV